MFVMPDAIFRDVENSERTVFMRTGRAISMATLRADTEKYIPIFQRINSDKVVLFVKDDVYQFIVWFFALAFAGKNIVLPADLKYGNVANLIKITPYVVTDESDIGDLIRVDLSDCFDTHDINYGDISNTEITFFTSGSTATPKEIRKGLATVFAGVRNIFNMHLSDTHGAVIVGSVTPFHMYGMLWRFMFPFCCGVVSDLDMVLTPEDLQEKQRQYDKIIFITIPSLMDKLVKYSELYEFKQNCVAILSSGSLLAAATSDGMYKIFGVSPIEIFGSTETGGVAWRQQKDGELWNLYPVANVTVNKDGCLVVNSPACVYTPYTMQDAVEMMNDNRFRLLGRVDRLIKIAEHRISLPQMEQRCAEHAFIDTAHCVLLAGNKIGLVATLTDAGRAFLKLHDRGGLVGELRQHLLNFFDNTAIPQKVRIVYEIPRNPQGKILQRTILPMFETDMPEPVVENLKQTENGFDADLTFVKNSSYFKGHFPTVSILPGVVQLLFVNHFLGVFAKKQILIDKISKLKFSHIIMPGRTVHLAVGIANDAVTFEYADSGELCSSGIISGVVSDV